MKKIRLYVHTNKVGSQCETSVEVDPEEWEAMTPKERDDFLFETLWQTGLVEWGYDE